MAKKLSMLLVITATVFLAACQNKSGLSLQNQTSLSAESPSNNASEIRASFLIFTSGTKRDFTSGKYHNLNPDVFIDPSSPTTIVVKKTGITWGDFFNTLPMKLTDECLTTGTGQQFCTVDSSSLSFYINGQKEESALSKVINHGDKLLVTYNQNNFRSFEKQINQVPTIN